MGQRVRSGCVLLGPLGLMIDKLLVYASHQLMVSHPVRQKDIFPRPKSWDIMNVHDVTEGGKPLIISHPKREEKRELNIFG